jgi:hypothetical protein
MIGLARYVIELYWLFRWQVTTLAIDKYAKEGSFLYFHFYLFFWYKSSYISLLLLFLKLHAV